MDCVYHIDETEDVIMASVPDESESESENESDPTSYLVCGNIQIFSYEYVLLSFHIIILYLISLFSYVFLQAYSSYDSLMILAMIYNF